MVKKPPRPFFATLLGLREVMAQNSSRIFGEDFLRLDEKKSRKKEKRGAVTAAVVVGKAAASTAGKAAGAEVITTTTTNTTPATTKTEPASALALAPATNAPETKKPKVLSAKRRREQERATQERNCLIMSFMNAVIVSAIEASPLFHGQLVSETFQSLIRDYDQGSEEFARHVEKQDGRVCGVLPNGKRLNPEENVAMTISYNQALENHHLMQCKQARALKLPRRELINLPAPNACHIALLEQKPKQQQQDMRRHQQQQQQQQQNHQHQHNSKQTTMRTQDPKSAPPQNARPRHQLWEKDQKEMEKKLEAERARQREERLLEELRLKYNQRQQNRRDKQSSGSR